MIVTVLFKILSNSKSSTPLPPNNNNWGFPMGFEWNSWSLQYQNLKNMQCSTN